MGILDDSQPPNEHGVEGQTRINDEPLVRNYLRVAGVISIAIGCAAVILFWYATHSQGDISPELRAEIAREQQANPNYHPYIASPCVTAVAIYLIPGGVSAIAGKTWALRWFLKFLAILILLGALVKKWG